MSTETNLWSNSPSQFINFHKFLMGVAVSTAVITAACYTSYYVLYALILPVGWTLWQYLVVRCLRYELTSERISLRTGVFNQQVNEVELYRIKDTTIQLPFLLRILKLGTLVLVTSDRTLPELELKAIRRPREVRDILRTNVERLRDLKRVREVDFEGGDDDFENIAPL
ncbi:MAG: PH domain-containing protein [Rubritalea sp.]|uniref:PH domain-containing protein n=1 Tax=Rubritalea sp. TaxID=2109375 RepID=UPI0032423549